MKKILLIILAVSMIVIFAGCGAYQTETNTTFGYVAPEEKNNIQLIVNKIGNNVEFKVTKNGYIIEADDYIFRNDNTHEVYNNYGTYGNILYSIKDDGYYTFGVSKEDIEIIYEFKLSELQETQIVNY